MSSQGVELAVLGLIQQDLAREYKLRQEVWVAEIDFERLLDFPLRSRKFQPISKFPAVERDFSLVVPDDVTLCPPFFRRRGLGAGGDSRLPARWIVSAAAQFLPGTTAFCCGSLFESQTHTLTSEEVGGLSQRLLAALEGLGAHLRG